MMSRESVRRAVETFGPRPTDVIVATFPKTGTTLVSWVCHLLRTDARCGERLARHVTLYEAVPWPLPSWDFGMDPNVQGSEYAPRVFKSHLRMASVYPGCRYVVTVRDPARTAASFYHFFLAKGVPFLAGAAGDALRMDASAFLMDTPFVRGSPRTPSSELRASLWEYYAEYAALMDCPAVLMLVYEDFLGDEATRRGNIRTLGEFMGVLERGDAAQNPRNDDGSDHAGEDLVARTAAMSTKAYMAPLVAKFDEPYARAQALGRAADVSQLAPGAKVCLGTHPQAFDARATRFLEDEWRAVMGPRGYADYSSFCVAVRARNRKWFG